MKLPYTREQKREHAQIRAQVFEIADQERDARAALKTAKLNLALAKARLNTSFVTIAAETMRAQAEATNARAIAERAERRGQHDGP